MELNFLVPCTFKRVLIQSVYLVLMVISVTCLDSSNLYGSSCDAIDDTWSREIRQLTEHELQEVKKLEYNQSFFRDELWEHKERGFSDSISVRVGNRGEMIFRLHDRKSEIIFTKEPNVGIFLTDINILLSRSKDDEKLMNVATLFKEIVFPGKIAFRGKMKEDFGD